MTIRGFPWRPFFGIGLQEGDLQERICRRGYPGCVRYPLTSEGERNRDSINKESPGGHAGNSGVFYPHCLDFIFNSPKRVSGRSDEPAGHRTLGRGKLTKSRVFEPFLKINTDFMMNKNQTTERKLVLKKSHAFSSVLRGFQEGRMILFRCCRRRRRGTGGGKRSRAYIFARARGPSRLLPESERALHPDGGAVSCTGDVMEVHCRIDLLLRAVEIFCKHLHGFALIEQRVQGPLV